MNRDEYLQQLKTCLAGQIPERELLDVLAYYRNYFDDAGVEHEAEVIAELGTPEQFARQLLIQRSESMVRSRGHRKLPGWGIALIIVGVIAVSARIILGLAGFAAWNVFSFSTSSVAETVQDVVGEATEYAAGTAVMVDSPVSETNMQAFSDIEINADMADVEIMAADTYGIELSWENEDMALSYQNEDGVLNIWNENGSGLINGEGGRIVIYVPQDSVMSHVEIYLGMGEVTFDNVTAEGGSIETGMGDIHLTGTFTGDTVIDTGMGDIDWSTTMPSNEYSYDFSTGVGEIQVDGSKRGTSVNQSLDTGKYLSINSGMGDITVNFGENY